MSAFVPESPKVEQVYGGSFVIMVNVGPDAWRTADFKPFETREQAESVLAKMVERG